MEEILLKYAKERGCNGWRVMAERYRPEELHKHYIGAFREYLRSLAFEVGETPIKNQKSFVGGSEAKAEPVDLKDTQSDREKAIEKAMHCNACLKKEIYVHKTEGIKFVECGNCGYSVKSDGVSILEHIDNWNRANIGEFLLSARALINDRFVEKGASLKKEMEDRIKGISVTIEASSPEDAAEQIFEHIKKTINNSKDKN